MSRSVCVGLLLLSRLFAAAPAAAAVSVTANDGAAFCPFAPALEQDPSDPDVLLGACEAFPSVVRIDMLPGAPISFPGPNYALAPDLDCSESGGATPRIANLTTDGPQRAWLVTSNCDLVVPFNPATGSGIQISFQGATRKAVPTRRTITGSYTTYLDAAPGAPVASFDTNLSSDALRVGTRLLVATSNFKVAGSNPELYPGTVLLFDIDDAGPVPSITPASPAYLITSDPNPTALTALPDGLVAVTNTGLLDSGFPPLVAGAGSIDLIDPMAGALLGSIPLGPNPGGRSLALDHPTDASVAVAGSHTLRALFALDIRGLAALENPGIDPTLQRPSCNDTAAASAGGLPCLRARAIHGSANPLALPAAPGTSGTAGFVPQVRFSASGDFVAATSFNDNGLALLAFDPRNLSLPHPLLPSRFGAPETESTLAPPVFGSECCPGPLVLHSSSAAGLAGSEVVWLMAFPAGAVVRATLSGALAAPFGDFDLDTVEDALDNCPLTANLLQEDAGSVGAGPADQIGDVCQCGDVDGSGIVLQADVNAQRAALADPLLGLAFPDKCDVSGDGACNLIDVVRARRALAALGPGLAQSCAPASL